MDTIDISTFSLLLSFLLLAIPIGTSAILGMGLTRPIIVSCARMAGQLTLMGVFLLYLFQLNNSLVNIAWLIVMILFAVLSAIRSSNLKITRILVPSFLSFFISTFFIILYINTLVIKIDKVLDARYLIVLGGMLLGNALRGNIIGINTFFRDLRTDRDHYLYTLSLGATRSEALKPYLRESLSAALKPSVAAMATMGIVSLPGMMTGQILGGASPVLAIKYQILIMIAIFVCVDISVLLTILLTYRASFTRYGTLDESIFIAE